MFFKNKWNDKDAKTFIKNIHSKCLSKDHALRVYTSRLIGNEPEFVMHGGGNTSCKTTTKDIYGNIINVLCVKGSGWDLGTIEAAGIPAVKLEPLLKLRSLDSLTDNDMVNIQRANLIDSNSPNPSVETLLHAFLPHNFIDHTHATAFLTLANLPNPKDALEEIFGKKIALVPYVMPGFSLSKTALEVYEKNKGCEGLLLAKHGYFTWGFDAKTSYDRVVNHTNMVLKWLNKNRKVHAFSGIKLNNIKIEEFLSSIRGLLGNKTQENTTLPVLNLISNKSNLSFMERSDVKILSTAGVATPDHVIRTKAHPLFLSRKDIAEGRLALKNKIGLFEKNYNKYFHMFAQNSAEPKKMLSSKPKLIWAEGIGIVGVGSDAKEAKTITDLATQNISVMSDGQDVGGFKPVKSQDLFDMEYWSLEQAKLGKKSSPELQGKVIVITGGTGIIGRAIAKAFFKKGAEIVLVDKNEKSLQEAYKIIGSNVKFLNIDLTKKFAAEKIISETVKSFGGVDILISNAGIAPEGSMKDISEKLLRDSFDLNFFAHFNLAKAFYSIFKNQQSDGQILFNISKQAVNPGENFGAYGLPKAALMFLVRQLALEFGNDGIRINGVNADRIQSGILNDEMIKNRAKARSINVDDYLSGNLLKRKVEAFHVAEAFLSLAKSTRTTGHIITVDGGNVEAALR